MTQSYLLLETPIGECGLAWSARGLTRLQLPEIDRRRAEQRLGAGRLQAETGALPEAIRQVIELIGRYMHGERTEFSGVALDLADVDPFRRSVYLASRSIGWGETLSYGELARRAGYPGEAREVGQALGRNPAAIIVPCHRILAKGGKVGGFSAHGGVLTKRRLLALEGVSLDAGTPLLPGLLPEPAASRERRS